MKCREKGQSWKKSQWCGKKKIKCWKQIFCDPYFRLWWPLLNVVLAFLINTIARFPTQRGVTCNGKFPNRWSTRHGSSKSYAELFLLTSSAEKQIRRVESEKPTKAEPVRWTLTKLVIVLLRFCRIAQLEPMSFVPESTRWEPFFDGQRGSNAATSSVCTVICFPDPTDQLSTTLANPNTNITTVETRTPSSTGSQQHFTTWTTSFAFLLDHNTRSTSTEPSTTMLLPHSAKLGHNSTLVRSTPAVGTIIVEQFPSSRLGLSSTSSMTSKIQQKSRDEMCRHQNILELASWAVVDHVCSACLNLANQPLSTCGVYSKNSRTIPSEPSPISTCSQWTTGGAEDIATRHNNDRTKTFSATLGKCPFSPWTSLICVSSPKCVYMCVKRCTSQTPNAFICVSPNAFICASPNAFICASPNAFICVSPNAFAESTTELASLANLCSLRYILV